MQTTETNLIQSWTIESAIGSKNQDWCRGIELNYRHMDFQSIALPLSYRGGVSKERMNCTKKQACVNEFIGFSHVCHPAPQCGVSGSLYQWFEMLNPWPARSRAGKFSMTEIKSVHYSVRTL